MFTFNPLIENLSALTDQQLEQKIADITKKYALAQRMNNFGMMGQIAGVLEVYRQEAINRTYAKQRELEKQQNPNLDPFASLDIN